MKTLQNQLRSLSDFASEEGNGHGKEGSSSTVTSPISRNSNGGLGGDIESGVVDISVSGGRQDHRIQEALNRPRFVHYQDEREIDNDTENEEMKEECEQTRNENKTTGEKAKNAKAEENVATEEAKEAPYRPSRRSASGRLPRKLTDSRQFSQMKTLQDQLRSLSDFASEEGNGHGKEGSSSTVTSPISRNSSRGLGGDKESGVVDISVSGGRQDHRIQEVLNPPRFAHYQDRRVITNDTENQEKKEECEQTKNENKTTGEKAKNAKAEENVATEEAKEAPYRPSRRSTSSRLPRKLTDSRRFSQMKTLQDQLRSLSDFASEEGNGHGKEGSSSTVTSPISRNSSRGLGGDVESGVVDIRVVDISVSGGPQDHRIQEALNRPRFVHYQDEKVIVNDTENQEEKGEHGKCKNKNMTTGEKAKSAKAEENAATEDESSTLLKQSKFSNSPSSRAPSAIKTVRRGNSLRTYGLLAKYSLDEKVIVNDSENEAKEEEPEKTKYENKTTSEEAKNAKAEENKATEEESSTLLKLAKFNDSPSPPEPSDVETGRGISLPTYGFLAKESLDEKVIAPSGRTWWHAVFVFSFISLVACIVTLWAPYPVGARMPSGMVSQTPWSNGCQGLESCICPRETICADDAMSMVFLTIARASAWFDYPLYMLLFLSKAHNLNNFLQGTMLRCWMNFSDYHKVHSRFGIIVGLESTSHAFFHILRWARRKDDIQLLVHSKTGITGMIVLLCCPIIVLPMTVPFLKKRMSFEWRKGLHYLFLVWALALMYHAPSRIFWLIGVPFVTYATDKLVGALHKTNLLENAYFERLSSDVCLITFDNPPGFGRQNAAYVYLVLPWLSKCQFHAFSVFPANKAGQSSICVSRAGWWTGALMDEITTPCHRTAYVIGPFLSPFSSPAMDSANLLVVASGIGVTPAISLVQRYSGLMRRINLVWICRDAGLVEHFLANFEFGDRAYTLIYYTGKRSIVLAENLPPNVFLFTGRPNLERTLSGIIYSIASGDGLPEEMCEDREMISGMAQGEIMSKLLIEKALSIYTMDQLYEYTLEASLAYETTSGGTNNGESSSSLGGSLPRRGNMQKMGSARLSSSFGGSLPRRSIMQKMASARDLRGLNISDQPVQSKRQLLRGASKRSLLAKEPSGRMFATGKSMRSLLAASQFESQRTLASFLDETVNYQGVLATMKQLLGDGFKFVEEDLAKNFYILSDDNTLDRDGFADLMANLTGEEKCEEKAVVRRTVDRLSKSVRFFGTSKHNENALGFEAEIKDLLHGDGQYSAKYWNMLYCGGSNAVVKQLKSFKQKFGVDLSIEKFDW